MAGTNVVSDREVDGLPSGQINPPYRTKRIAFRGPDGQVIDYLRVPDKTDPVYQTAMQEHADRLGAALDHAADELGITRDELDELLTSE